MLIYLIMCVFCSVLIDHEMLNSKYNKYLYNIDKPDSSYDIEHAHNACKHCGINVHSINDTLYITELKENKIIVFSFSILCKNIFDMDLDKEKSQNIDKTKKNLEMSYMVQDPMKMYRSVKFFDKTMLLDTKYSKIQNLLTYNNLLYHYKKNENRLANMQRLNTTDFHQKIIINNIDITYKQFLDYVRNLENNKCKKIIFELDISTELVVLKKSSYVSNVIQNNKRILLTINKKMTLNDKTEYKAKNNAKRLQSVGKKENCKEKLHKSNKNTQKRNKNNQRRQVKNKKSLHNTASKKIQRLSKQKTVKLPAKDLKCDNDSFKMIKTRNKNKNMRLATEDPNDDNPLICTTCKLPTIR